MNDSIGTIILRVNGRLNNSADIRILDKTMLDWVKIACGETLIDVVPAGADMDIPSIVAASVDPSRDYTVILFSDTPLISPKTIGSAVAQLKAVEANVIKMTRGFVFETKYLLAVDKVYSPTTYYFEEEDFITAYSMRQVGLITEIMRMRILTYHMERGVHIVDPSSTFIDSSVVIGNNVTIEPFNIIKGKTFIRDNVTVNASNTIDSAIIDCGAVITSSTLSRCFVGSKTTVGPHSYIRPDTVVGEHCRIGDFVELKKCKIGDRSKVSHLAYVGDAEIGTDCNIGCGTVFVNYDGVNKHHTKIGNNVFVGSNSNLIAPLFIEDNAFIAAGSTIHLDIASGQLAIARSRQTNKSNWTRPTK